MNRLKENLPYLGILLAVGGYILYNTTLMWDWKAQALIYGGAALAVLGVLLNLSAIRETLSSRSRREGGTALATLVLVLAILALVNFLNTRHHKRVDLTEGRQHALSEQTASIARNLDRRIELIGFFADEAGARRFQSLAREYQYLSSQIGYEVVDPQKDPARAAQFEVARVGEIIVAGGSRRESVQEISEERITNAIIRVTRDEEKVVYMLQGHGERDPASADAEGFSAAREALERQNYRVEAYNLAQENRIPDDAAVIVSAGPRMPYFAHEIPLLRGYLEQGGKFLLLADPQNDFEAAEFLEAYGVQLQDNVVIDASGLGQLLGLGPAAPIVAEYADHPITQDFRTMMSFFPFARGVATTSSPLTYQTVELLKTSDRSWGETNLEAERVRFDEGEDEPGPIALAVAARKSVTPGEAPAALEADRDAEAESQEAVSESIEIEGEEPDAAVAPDERAEEPDAERVPAADLNADAEAGESAESRLIVVGDSDFASNQYFSHPVHADLFLNLVSWLAEDADLISIRPRDPTSRSLVLTETQSRMIFWATVLFFPLLTLAVGLSVWFRRR